MAARVALHRGAEVVIGVDLVPERPARAKARGVHTLDAVELGDGLIDEIRRLTRRAGHRAVIDAVGMEAHGNRVPKSAQGLVGRLPDSMGQKAMEKTGMDSMTALTPRSTPCAGGRDRLAVRGVRRPVDPLPMLTLFDKQIQPRMGQANVHHWVDDILPLLVDDDPLGVDSWPRTVSPGGRTSRRTGRSRPSRTAW